MARATGGILAVVGPTDLQAVGVKHVQRSEWPVPPGHGHIADRGRIIGYRYNFFDALALYATAGEPEGPFQVFTGVQMFDTADSAFKWPERSFQITRDFVGQTQDRFTLIDVTETLAPELGDKAMILRKSATFSGPPCVDIVMVSVRWSRGPMVAAVQVDTVNSKVYRSAVLQLALGMDARTNGVLTGAQ